MQNPFRARQNVFLLFNVILNNSDRVYIFIIKIAFNYIPLLLKLKTNKLRKMFKTSETTEFTCLKIEGQRLKFV